MTITLSSGILAGGMQGALQALGNTAVLQVYDASNNLLAEFQLSSNPARIVGNAMVLVPFPQGTTVSSLAPVGAIPTTATVASAPSSAGGVPLISGITVAPSVSFVALGQNQVNPGDTISGVSAHLVLTARVVQ